MRTAVLLVGIAAGLILGFIRLANVGALSPTVVVSVVLAIGLTVSLALRQRMAATGTGSGADDDIRRRGIVGRATLISARATGRAEAGRHEYDLRLEVRLPRRHRFDTEVRTLVPDSFRERLRPGQAIAVAADPAEPGHVVPAFDVDELVSIAGLRRFVGRPADSLNPPRPPEPDDDR